MQYVEVELDPGESAVAEAGGMMYMTNGIIVKTIFGDGSESQQAGEGSILDHAFGLGNLIDGK